MTTPNTNALAVALAAQLATAAGCAGFSATDVDFVPALDGASYYYGVLLSNTMRATPGSWEELMYVFRGRAYVERAPDAGTVQQRVNNAADALFIAIRTGMSLGGLALQSVVETWDTSKFYEIGKTQYGAVDLTIRVQVMSAETYTS